MNTLRYLHLSFLLILIFPILANAWIFGIKFSLSNDQLSKLAIHSVEIPWHDRNTMILKMYNGNEKITITELTMRVMGNYYIIDREIPPYSTKKVAFKFSLDTSMRIIFDLGYRGKFLLEERTAFKDLLGYSTLVEIETAKGKR